MSTASFPTAQSSATQLVQQFKLLKSLKFPKCKFGKKGEERAIICIVDSQNIHHMIIITTLRFNLRASNFKFWGMPPDRLESSMFCMPIFGESWKLASNCILPDQSQNASSSPVYTNYIIVHTWPSHNGIVTITIIS